MNVSGPGTDGGPAAAMTERLLLRPPAPADVDDVFELYRDPAVWAADPMMRHHDIEQTERAIERWGEAWRRGGLGMWVARSAEPATAGAFVGIGGCFVRAGVAWNLGFRLRPLFWGHGYAQELSRAAIDAARVARPELPVTAYLLDGNARSRRATERLGLTLVWRGPDAGNPDETAVRLLYADRALSPDVVTALTER